MKLRHVAFFALTAMLAITVSGLTAHAEQAQNLNLSDAQVFRIQALLLQQSKDVRTLTSNVQAAQESLSAAVAKGDPALTAIAVLSLDAAEKALKQTQLANQKTLMSLLNESQKQVLVKDSAPKSIPASD